MEDSKAMATSKNMTTTLVVDEEGEHVDHKEYQSMIGSLLYLTATRPDIQFNVCLCACFQASLRATPAASLLEPLLEK
jgi:murein endopeptidase